ncbi:MAG: carbohydrate ABC transporter permease, partial [Clostridiales bacterium]|nr:carbohydrate ABC transporter permease [Clostridiales bacterium]
STYNTILMMNFFRGIPRELDEAAAIDGASPWRILFTIYLPISLPVIATLALFCMMWHWNDYFTGLIYINDAAKYPLQTYIRNLTVDMDFDTMSHEELIQRMEIGAITFNAAKIVISMIPVMVVYPFLQKYFVKGLVLGSVKG